MKNYDNNCLLCSKNGVDFLTNDLRRCKKCNFFFLSEEARQEQQKTFQATTTQPVNQEHLNKLRNKYPKNKHGKRVLYAKYADMAVNWYGENISVLDVGASGGFFLNQIEILGAKPSNLRTLEVDRTYQALTEEYFGYEGDISNIEIYKADR